MKGLLIKKPWIDYILEGKKSGKFVEVKQILEVKSN